MTYPYRTFSKKNRHMVLFFCEAVQEKLAELGKGRLQIIEADMNAKPEQEEMSFEAFKNKSFMILRSNVSTDVNS